MRKVKISICSNPHCYVEGARLFKQLDTIMSARLKEKTVRTGTRCNGFCEACGANAPCALINDMPIFRATPEKILRALAKS
jgi:NADH:ubiquinone oxidoreductase subunit E